MKLLKRALDERGEALKAVEAAKKEAAEAKAALQKKAEEEVQREKATAIDAILHELTEIGIEEADLEACRKELAELDDKALAALESVIEKVQSKVSGAGLPKSEGLPKPEGVETFSSLDEGEGDVPPVMLGPEKTSQGSAVERLSNLWTQDTLNRG